MNKVKRLRRIGIFEIFNTLLMLAVCFVTLYPMWFVFVNSLNAPEQALLGTVNWLPKEFSLASYSVVFNDKNLDEWLLHHHDAHGDRDDSRMCCLPRSLLTA